LQVQSAPGGPAGGKGANLRLWGCGGYMQMQCRNWAGRKNRFWSAFPAKTPAKAIFLRCGQGLSENRQNARRRAFSRHTLLIFLTYIQYACKKSALSGEKIPRCLAFRQSSNKP